MYSFKLENRLEKGGILVLVNYVSIPYFFNYCLIDKSKKMHRYMK